MHSKTEITYQRICKCAPGASEGPHVHVEHRHLRMHVILTVRIEPAVCHFCGTPWEKVNEVYIGDVPELEP